jgi:hypothetical protein
MEDVDPTGELAVTEEVDVRGRQVVRPGALDLVDTQSGEFRELFFPLILKVWFHNDRCRADPRHEHEAGCCVGLAQTVVVPEQQ